jgi:hypothetical protein
MLRDLHTEDLPYSTAVGHSVGLKPYVSYVLYLSVPSSRIGRLYSARELVGDNSLDLFTDVSTIGRSERNNKCEANEAEKSDLFWAAKSSDLYTKRC